MPNISLKSRIAAGLIICSLPFTAIAQTPELQARFDAAATFCNTSTEDECLSLVYSILADIRAQYSGEQYDFALASFVATLAAVPNASSSSTTFDVIAAAIEGVANAATDPAQAAQMLVIADIIDNEEIVVVGSDLIIASPN